MVGLRVAATFCVGVTGKLQTFQRAEFLVLALQTFSGIHIGIDNLYVLRDVAKFIDRGIEGTSLPLIKNRDLSATIHSMLGL